MNRTIKEATVTRCYNASQHQLRWHFWDFFDT
jgi:hypothetical protein